MSGDEPVVERWWQDWRRQPTALPAGLQPVQTRLVRSVGRGALPSGEVFVKLMAFPRGKDRLRYSLRPLPARHEARLLAAVAALGLPCPEVVAVRTARSPLPRASMLVLRALPLAAHAAVAPERELLDRAVLAKALLDGGILHPDLNAGNFVRLADGRLAVLDLQSARRRSPACCRAAGVAVAARLLRDVEALPAAVAEAALLQSGLLADAAAVAAARARAAAEQRAFLRGRVRRCLCESSEFTVGLGWSGRSYRRRAHQGSVTAVRGRHGELLASWIGDRALQVMEGRPPTLVGMFRRWRWLPGASCVYIPGQVHDLDIRREFMILQEGFLKYRWLLTGSEPGAEAVS